MPLFSRSLPTILSGRRLWTPSRLPGLLLALDASDAETVIRDGSNVVSQWNSKFGANINLAGSGTRQPAWSATGLNSAYPAVTFDGSSDCLQASTAPFYVAGSATWYGLFRAPSAAVATVFMAEKRDSTNTPNYCLIRTQDSTASSAATLIRNDANSVRLASSVVVQTSVFGSSVAIYGAIDSGTGVTPRLNGTAGAASAYTRSGAMTLDRVGLGANAIATPASFMAVEVALVFGCTGALSTSDCEKLEGWIAHHRVWSSAVSLPSDHPYKTSAPQA